MRTPLITLLLVTSLVQAASSQDLTAARAAEGHARYRLSLAALREAKHPEAYVTDADRSVAAAAIDAARERLHDRASLAPSETTAIATALLKFAADPGTQPALARRALHATTAGSQTLDPDLIAKVTALALNPTSSVRLDAIVALSQLGDGSQVVTLAQLAGESEARVAETAREGLVSIQGKGVSPAFIRGIGETTLGDQSRIALLQAATKRGMVAATPAAIQAMSEPTLRLESQKAVLKLARKADLPALRTARGKLTAESATQASSLDRLIVRLEKE